jgi:hypothetical protein
MTSSRTFSTAAGSPGLHVWTSPMRALRVRLSLDDPVSPLAFANLRDRGFAADEILLLEERRQRLQFLAVNTGLHLLFLPPGRRL